VKESDSLGVLTIWDAANKRRVGSFPLDVGQLIAARFSPDGRSLVLAYHPLGVVLIETATWKVRASFLALTCESRRARQPWRDCDALAWSSDSRLLAVAGPDGGLSIWDTMKLGGPVAEFDGPALEKAWTGLATADAKTGLQAARCFFAAGDRGIAFLKSKISAVSAPDAKYIKDLITVLGADDFLMRESATAELKKLGRIAGPVLQEAIKTSKSPEAIGRMKDLLGAWDRAKPTPDELRVIRVMETVEWMGTPNAIKLLEVWAGGADGALLTTEARASLDRRKR
jgi:hypothetical protein